MTEAEKIGKAVESAKRHIAMFREYEDLERGRLEKGGPYPTSEEVSFRQADYYAGRVKEHEAALRQAEAELAAMKRPPLA